MSPLQVLRVAMRALLRNKMRSFLTTLGVIIGVSAVIAMVAIGEGAKARVAEAFASMGSNILMVLSGSTTSGGARRIRQHAHADLGRSESHSQRGQRGSLCQPTIAQQCTR